MTFAVINVPSSFSCFTFIFSKFHPSSAVAMDLQCPQCGEKLQSNHIQCPSCQWVAPTGCRHYARGKCRYGKRCKFIHADKATNQDPSEQQQWIWEVENTSVTIQEIDKDEQERVARLKQMWNNVRVKAVPKRRPQPIHDFVIPSRLIPKQSTFAILSN